MKAAILTRAGALTRRDPSASAEAEAPILMVICFQFPLMTPLIDLTYIYVRPSYSDYPADFGDEAEEIQNLREPLIARPQG